MLFSYSLRWPRVRILRRVLRRSFGPFGGHVFEASCSDVGASECLCFFYREGLGVYLVGKLLAHYVAFPPVILM